MPVPTVRTDLSATISSNSPADTEVRTTADDYYRAHAGFIKQNYDDILILETVPTVQKFTTGSGTYTTPANVKHIKVRMVGGGGGGGGGGTAGAGNGGVGVATTFGASLLNAGGGSNGVVTNGPGGAGGTASLGSGPIGDAIPGSQGGPAFILGGTDFAIAGYGGNSPYFTGGGHNGAADQAGGAGRTNSGGGGGGGSGGNVASVIGGSGGGSGGFVEAIIGAPSATYAYAVGTGGAGGAAGTNGRAGGAGGSGYVIVWEYYA